MPLLPGKKNIGVNIKKEVASGKSKAQSTAIALNVARKSGANIPPPPKASAPAAKAAAGPPPKKGAPPAAKKKGAMPPQFQKKK